jgi:hypothetical protein
MCDDIYVSYRDIEQFLNYPISIYTKREGIQRSYDPTTLMIQETRKDCIENSGFMCIPSKIQHAFDMQ